MGLTRSQSAIWEKARSLGSGDQAVGLADGMCSYLIARIAHDLNLQKTFPEFPQELPVFFSTGPLVSLVLEGHDCRTMFERLVAANPDADTYFACLAALHKARLKYERILSTQPIPTLEQVGPRGLLQYGKLNAEALVGFLYWRKWFFDIDNRAGQETGYLFEPIIAHAIGGTPAPARKSPVKRHNSPQKGRQVDCLIEKRAYELKIRVTLAASGQGRWREELDFPVDCRSSGFQPVLVCMDGTPNPKLSALVRAFEEQDGEVFVGEAAWQHLEETAGGTMSRFLDAYVRAPIQDLLEKSSESLPKLTVKCCEESIEILIGDERLPILRETTEENTDPPEKIPDDADREIPG